LISKENKPVKYVERSFSGFLCDEKFKFFTNINSKSQQSKAKSQLLSKAQKQQPK
jgi:hypothetical protein